MESYHLVSESSSPLIMAKKAVETRLDVLEADTMALEEGQKKTLEEVQRLREGLNWSKSDTLGMFQKILQSF